MATIVRFDSAADVVGAAPDPARWEPAPPGIATADLKLSNPALVGEDGAGRYLGPGLPVLCRGDLLPSRATARIELAVELDGRDAMARVILPLSDLLAGGDKASAPGVDTLSPGDLQYVYVEAMLRKLDMVLNAYITDPFSKLGSGSLSGTRIARAVMPRATVGRLSVEAGPRFVRAWFDAGEFGRRVPDLGCAIPWIDLDRWGCFCGGAKIRSVAFVPEIEEVEAESCGVSGVPDQEPEPASAAATSTRDYSRPVDLRYLAPPHVRRRRACLMIRGSGPGATGRLADHFYRRLDAERTLIYVPNGESQSVDVSSLGEDLSGEASEAMLIATEVDASDGPGAGIGSGRANLDDGGEPAMNLPLAREDAQFVYRQQTSVADQGGPLSIAQSSSRPGEQWKFSVNLNPKHLRRAERLVAMAGGARSFWAFPPLGPRQIPVFTRTLSHEIAGPKRSLLQLDLEKC